MERIDIGTRLVCTENLGYGLVLPGTKGVYTFGSDYVCGWDAGMFTVSDERGKTLCNHWTYEEMMRSWKVDSAAENARTDEERTATRRRLLEKARY